MSHLLASCSNGHYSIYMFIHIIDNILSPLHTPENTQDSESSDASGLNIRVKSSDSSHIKILSTDIHIKLYVILGVTAASGLANIQHGLSAILTASLKQGAYSSVSALATIQFYDYLAARVKTMHGELTPAVLPALLTILANYSIHCFRGTAEPVLSSLPTAILAGIGFPLWHFRTRLLELHQSIEAAELTFDEDDLP